MNKRSPLMLVIAIAILVIAAGVIYYVADQSEKGSHAVETTKSTRQGTMSAPTGTPYVIGVDLDITKNGAPLGTAERDALNMLATQINMKGINGHPVKLIIEDNASDSTQSVSVLKKLIGEDKVIAVIGTSQTGTTMPLLPVITDAKIPLISCAAGNAIVNPPLPYVFKTAQSDILAVGKVYAYLKEKKLTDIAVITDDLTFGTSGLDQLHKQAKDAGINIVDEEVFKEDPGADMSPQLMKISRSTAKAVVCWGTNPGPANIAKEMATMNLKLPLVMSHGIASKKFIDLAGDAANGVVFPAGKLLVVDSLPDSDAQKKVLLTYRTDFANTYPPPHSAADTFGGHAYDALHLLCDALKVAGPDPVKLRDALETTSGMVGVSGVFTFSPTDHNGLDTDCFAMVTIQDGKWVPAE